MICQCPHTAPGSYKYNKHTISSIIDIFILYHQGCKFSAAYMPKHPRFINFILKYAHLHTLVHPKKDITNKSSQDLTQNNQRRPAKQHKERKG